MAMLTQAGFLVAAAVLACSCSWEEDFRGVEEEDLKEKHCLLVQALLPGLP